MIQKGIQRVGVIGGGQMGSGIAQILAVSTYAVILQDIRWEALDLAQSTIHGGLQKLVLKGKLSQNEVDLALSRITFQVSYEGFNTLDLVIEAATECPKLKQEILSEIIKYIHDDCIVATNTSSISITKLGGHFGRPENFIGMHFMNPVPLMSLVEIIRGLQTSEETYQVIHVLVQNLGKTSILARDYPGFIVNRILMPMINESIYVVMEGVGSVEDVDLGMKLGTNQPMGPLALADLIGLDTCLAIMQVLHQELGDSKYRPCPLLVKYVEAGWLGHKTKRGFYSY